MKEKGFVSVSQAAKLLKVSRSHVYTLIERGALTKEPANPIYLKGGPVRIPMADIERIAREKGIELTP